MQLTGPAFWCCVVEVLAAGTAAERLRSASEMAGVEEEHVMRIRRLVRAVFLALVLLAAYAVTYVAWSGSAMGNGERLWSFFPPPAGLMPLELKARYARFGPTAWDGWRNLERIPGAVFRPCIVLDEALTRRVYLPNYKGSVCFN
jgi:hypothetical protein